MKKQIERYEKYFYIRTRFGKKLRVIYVPRDMVENTVFLSGDGLEDRVVKKDLLFKAQLCLGRKYWRVIQFYYLDGLTMREIGNLIGVSEGRISQLHAEAIRRLKGYFIGD